MLIEISYTDDIGVRRMIEKEVSISGYGGASGKQIDNPTPRFSSTGLIYIGIGIIGVVCIVGFFLLRKRKKKK